MPLDFKNFGNKLVQSLEAITSPNLAMDPAQLEMLAPEQREQAIRRARYAGNAGMAAAASQNLPWYATLGAKNEKGQSAYDQYVSGAVASVEELRKRRESADSRGGVGKLVAGIISGEIQTDLTDQQKSLLPSLTPDEQKTVLQKYMYPKEMGVNVATSGVVVGSDYELPNGNRGYTIQDPSAPSGLRHVDSGIKYIERPSRERLLQAYANDPEMLRMILAEGQAGATGTKTGEANVSARVALPQQILQARNSISTMESLRDELAALPSGALTGRVLGLFSSQFQTAGAAAYGEMLREIGRLKQNEGVSLNPITENELAILAATSPKLTNNPEANAKIINDRIERGRRVLAQIESQLEWIRSGNDITDWDPNSVGQPGRPAPAPAGGGGAPARSQIPVLPQHRTR
jgi:hypothetical protein